MSPWEDPANYQVIHTYAFLWATAALDIATIDHTWCPLIGAANGADCNKTDGLVPDTVSRWPGTTSPQVMIGNIGHTEQPSHPSTWVAVANALKDAGFGLPPQLTVGSIQGANLVDPYSSTTYSVAASGPGTISYRWMINGSTQQNGASTAFSFSNSGSNFTVSVQVTNGSSSITRSLAVSVGSCGSNFCE